MAITRSVSPPPAPTSGDRWINASTGFSFTWNGVFWVQDLPALAPLPAPPLPPISAALSITSTPNYTTAPTPPLNPSPCDLWFDSTTGFEFVYYDDGNTQQWVVTNPGRGPQGAPGMPGPPGPAGGVQIADNNDMLNALPSTSGSVMTLGRVTPNDGGGGVWAWRDGDQSANVDADPLRGLWMPPGSTPSGDAGAWERVFTGSPNGQWWGMSSLASATVNTAALQAAVNYVGNNSAILYVPGGDYQIDGEISFAACTTRFGIVGERGGMRITRFLLTAFGGAKKFLKGVNPNTDTRTLENLYFADFEISTVSAVASRDHPIGIYLPYDSGSVIDNVRVRVLGNTGIWIGAGNNTFIKDTWVNGGGFAVTVDEDASLNFLYSATGTTLTADSGTPFEAGDVGRAVYITDAGEQGFPFATMIAGFVSGSQVTLAHPVVTNVAGKRISFDAIRGTMALGSNVLSLDGPLFASTDVGRFVYVEGAGPGGAVLVTTMTGFTSASSVTLATAAATAVTAKYVYLTPAYFIGGLTADESNARRTNDVRLLRPLAEGWQGCDYLFHDGVNVWMTNGKSHGFPDTATRMARNSRGVIASAMRGLTIQGIEFDYGYCYGSGPVLISGGVAQVQLSSFQASALLTNQALVDFDTTGVTSQLIFGPGFVNKDPTLNPPLVRRGAGVTALQVTQGGPIRNRTTTLGTAWAYPVPSETIEAVWFGAKGDGVTDDTAALQAALNVAGGKTLMLGAGRTYKISAILNITQSDVTIQGNGATINGAAVPVPTVFNTECAILVSGTLDALTATLNVNAAKGARLLTVISSAGFTAGDTLFVRSSTEAYPEGSTTSSLAKKGTMHVLREVPNSTQLSLMDGTQHSFLSTTTTITKVNTVKRVSIENLNIVMGGKNKAHCGVRFKYTEDCWFRDGSIKDGEDANFRVEYSIGGGVERSLVENATSPDQGTSGVTVDTGYGIAVQSCVRGFRVLNNRARNNKHSVTGGGNYPTVDVLVQGNNFEGSRIVPAAGYDAECHEETANWKFIANDFGGSSTSPGSGGLMIRGQDCEAGFNHIWNAWQYGIYVHAFGTNPNGLNGANVHHNVIDGSRLYGIYVFGEVTSPVRDVILGHNLIRNAQSDGIRLSVTQGARLAGNVIKDVAVNASTSGIRIAGSATAGDRCSDIAIDGGTIDGVTTTYGVHAQFVDGISVSHLNVRDTANSPLRYENCNDIDQVGGRFVLASATLSAVIFSVCERATILGGQFSNPTVSTASCIGLAGVCNDISVIGVTAGGFARLISTGGTPNHVITLGNNGRLCTAEISNTAASQVNADNLPGAGSIGGTTSLAALKALPANAIGSITTQYRTTAGDGGGGRWNWRSGDQSANITVDPQSGLWAAPASAPTGASGAWQRDFSGAIAAAWYGVAAANTGAVNIAALQACVDAVIARVNAGNGLGGEITLPFGSISLNGTLSLRRPNNVVPGLRFQGDGGYPGVSGTRLTWQPSVAGTLGLLMSSVQQIEWNDIEFVCGNANISTLINIEAEVSPTFSSFHPCFNRCGFRTFSGINPSARMMRIVNTAVAEFNKCWFSGNENHMLLGDNGTGTEGNGTVGDILFNECQIYWDIQVGNVEGMTFLNSIFARRNATIPVRIYPSASGFVRQQRVTFIGCSQVSITSGVEVTFWEQGVGAAGLVALNNRWDGYKTTFLINGAGYATLDGNSYNAPAAVAGVVGIQIAASAKEVYVGAEDFSGLWLGGFTGVVDSSTAVRTAQAILGADVLLNNTANYFNGPTTGSIGDREQKWMITANYVVAQPAGGPDFYGLQIWNGAAVVGAEQTISAGAGINQPGMVQAIVTLTGATTFTLRARDFSSTTGKLLASGTSIAAVRIA